MRFHAILATIVAFITFALADPTVTTTWSSTVTVTRTLMHYNATSTMWYSGTGSSSLWASGTGMGHGASTTATSVHSPSLTAVASPSAFKGAASVNSPANLAAAAFVGMAAYALGAL